MPVIKVRNLGSAPRATAIISSTLTGFNASGRQTSVTTENAITRNPQCAATMTSGTVDMPTTSAPIIRKTLSHEQAPLRSWLLFHDDDYAAEWIGIYGQTPEPPQVPQLEG